MGGVGILEASVKIMQLGVKGEDMANDEITCLLGSHRIISFHPCQLARQLLRDKTAKETKRLGKLF